MGSHRKKSEIPQVLSGWKEIANYLGKGVRTVQRYESELGLPVRRPAGRATGSVIATRPELDAWVMASPIQSSFLLSPRTDDVSQGTTEAIRNNLAQTGQLSEQMMQLRTDIKALVHVLQHSLEGLQETLNANRYAVPDARAVRLDSEGSTSHIWDLLRHDAHRKAS